MAILPPLQLLLTATILLLPLRCCLHATGSPEMLAAAPPFLPLWGAVLMLLLRRLQGRRLMQGVGGVSLPFHQRIIIINTNIIIIIFLITAGMLPPSPLPLRLTEG